MNVPCGLIQDLLPLYYDEVCSQESRSLVEEHLAECPACRQWLADLQTETPLPEEAEEAAALKEVQTTWKKNRKRARWKGAVIALVAIFFATCPLWLTIHKGTDVPSENIQISQTCQLEDGTIVFHLYIDDGKTLDTMDLDFAEDGSAYFTPKQALLEPKRTSEDGLFNTYLAFNVTQDTSNINEKANLTFTGDPPAVYVGTPEDRVLVWEKGMDLPPATPAIEEMMAEIYPSYAAFCSSTFDWVSYNETLKELFGNEMAGKEALP